MFAAAGYSSFPARMTIAHSTIASNVSDANASGGETGGGIDSEGPDVLATHTIVARNFRSGFSTRDDVSGEITASFSLIGDGTGATITDSGGNQIGNSITPINPLFGNLAENGGPTATLALLAGSPAIDAGDPAAVAGAGGVPHSTARDTIWASYQWRWYWPQRIDIGAVEKAPTQPALPAITTTTTESTRRTTRCGGTRWGAPAWCSTAAPTAAGTVRLDRRIMACGSRISVSRLAGRREWQRRSN